MDTALQIKRLLKEDKGIIIVVVAGLMMLILLVTAFAVDLSYRHVARTELQNAADAAALAGATKVPVETDARDAAIAYAAQHKAASDTVALAAGDVQVGNYDPNRGVNPFVAGATPYNAVMVQARRTEAGAAPASQGQVPTFFARTFGVESLPVRAVATAQRMPRANGYFVVSPNVCGMTIPAGGLALSPSDNNMAWTALTEVVSGNEISKIICKPAVPNVEVGPGPVYTTNGTVAQTFKDLEGTFFDHAYDSDYKTLAPDGSVGTWKVIVPVSVETDPTTCSNHECGLYGYAEVIITRVCGSGGGNACRPNKPPAGRCSGGESDIVISGITCVTYENRAQLLGRKAYLVKNNQTLDP